MAADVALSAPRALCARLRARCRWSDPRSQPKNTAGERRMTSGTRQRGEAADNRQRAAKTRALEIGRYDAAIAAQEGSQGCERFLRAPLVCVVSWKRAASAALDGVPDCSSAAGAAPNHEIPLPGVLAKSARTPGYRLVAADAALSARLGAGCRCSVPGSQPTIVTGDRQMTLPAPDNAAKPQITDNARRSRADNAPKEQ